MPNHQISLGGFLLTLYTESLVVEARPLTAYETVVRTEEENPPAWIFNSRRTIWIAESGGPIRERALQGERIRHMILQSDRMAGDRARIARSA